MSGRGVNVVPVFVHAFGGSASSWDMVRAVLAPNAQGLAMTLPGFGGAPLPEDALSVDFYADVVEAAIRAAGLGAFSLVGHSMGGKIVLALAARRPTGLMSVVLAAPSPPSPEPMRDRDREALRASFGHPAQGMEILRAAIGRPLDEKVLQTLLANRLAASRKAWNWWLDEGSREDITGRMGDIEVPATILAGCDDANLGPEVQRRRTASPLPQAQVYEIAGAGHLLPQEAPQAVAEAFIRGVAA